MKADDLSAPVTRVLMVALLSLASCASFAPPLDEQRVLLVGNSVIYTNNLPAVLAHVDEAAPSGATYRFDMLARGGATLVELAQDAAVVQMLESGRYDVVLFQERGGDGFCVLQPEDRRSTDCQELIDGHIGLADKARANGARVLYLGTYQLAPDASKTLVQAEHTLAEQMGATYVEVSERLQKLRSSAPDLPWLYVDNGHPGIATTALMALLIHEALEGETFVPPGLCTSAEMYTPGWKHQSVAYHADLTSKVQPKRCLLDPLELAVIASGAAPDPAAMDGP